MGNAIVLTKKESSLRQLLLDTSDYIGTLEGCKKPELRITGGWVRDKLLGLQSVDIDIGIDTMTGFRFGNLMKEYLAQPGTRIKFGKDVLGSLAKIGANPEKSKHLETVTTRILGLDIDLVNLRKETYVEDSRNPTMEFGTPEEDALRRDATVNALFYNLPTSTVEDFTGRGLKDMEGKVIKTPLAPLQTFKDDPLRVLRAVRFASRLNYHIAAEDEAAMKDASIKAALKLKISRERVGVEVTKMLRGPNPRIALSLIDRLGLYNEVFTDPTDPECQVVETSRWYRAYNQLSETINPGSPASEGTSSTGSTGIIATSLLRNTDDVIRAWMMAAFVPWARETPNPPDTSTKKKPLSPAAVAAREGIKADNKISRLVDDAVSHLQDVIIVKDALMHDESRNASPSKRIQGAMSRDKQGQAIRTWGSNWRSSVIYALLTQVAETETPAECDEIVKGYAAWLSYLKTLNLLDVDQLQPIVNGNDLAKALGTKHGPWMKKALDIAMDWQLRHPDETDAAGGVAEVVKRKNELGIA